MKILKYISSALFLAFFYFIIVLYKPTPNQYRFKPSGYHVFVPESQNLPFQTYIKVNQARIKSALGPLFENHKNPYPAKYTLDYVAQHAAPFEILPIKTGQPQKLKGYKTGFVFIHGLGKSANDFRSMAKELHQHYPQSLMRGTLLSGHGTIIGDTLQMHRNQWRKSVNYTILSMTGKVDDLYLVGYSAGATLIIDYIQTHKTSTQTSTHNLNIKGLILLDLGLAAKDPWSRITPLLRHLVAYDDILDDSYPLTYSSWTHNLSAEFLKLTQETKPLKLNKIPTLMTINTDDDTIDINAANSYFCSKNKNPLKTLIAFQGTKQSPTKCKGTQTFSLKNYPELKQRYRFINFSHKSSINSPNDPLFGFDKEYRNCDHYFFSKKQYQQCKTTNENTVYGSLTLRNNPDLLKGRLLRRIEFNPLYHEMMNSIKTFIDKSITL
jgi:esterase/lipase